MSRKTSEAFYVRQNGGWIETTAVAADIAAASGIFEPLTVPVPGCVVVYPDYRGADGTHHEGHIAIVTQTNGQNGLAGIVRVVHCSVSNDASGDAIQETPAGFFGNHPSRIGWCIRVAP